MKKILLTYFFISFFVFSKEMNFKKINSSLRLSNETIKINSNENMQVYGFHFDIEKKYEKLNTKLGLGVYGSSGGERGGFFVGGYTLGLDYYIYKNFKFKLMFFAGGGGGGAAPQGSGLMLREFYGIGYDFNCLNLNFGYSKVDFPDGEIKGNNYVLELEFPFSFWIGTSENIENTEDLKLNYIKKMYLRPMYQVYIPNSNNKNTLNQNYKENIESIGIRLDTYLNENYYILFSSYGAFRGEVDGFAQMFTGLGYSYKLRKDTYLSTNLKFGSAGGGRVDSGNGLLSGLSLELLYKNVLIGYGKTVSFNNKFSADTINFSLGKELNLPYFNLEEGKYNFDKKYDFNSEIINKIYYNKKSKYKNGNNLPNIIEQVGFSLNKKMYKNFYFYGEAYGAYRGKIGGYAEGLFGIGTNYKLNENFKLELKGLIGAAGGGGVDLGNGLIYELETGIKYNKNSYFASLRYGIMESFEGNFKADVIEVGLGKEFSIPNINF